MSSKSRRPTEKANLSKNGIFLATPSLGRPNHISCTFKYRCSSRLRILLRRAASGAIPRLKALVS